MFNGNVKWWILPCDGVPSGRVCDQWGYPFLPLLQQFKIEFRVHYYSTVQTRENRLAHIRILLKYIECTYSVNRMGKLSKIYCVSPLDPTMINRSGVGGAVLQTAL